MNTSTRYLPYTIVSGLFSLMMLFSGTTKILMLPEVVEVIHGQIGVPRALIPLLGALLVCGALGLLAGNFRPKLGVAAAAGLVLYFIGAMVSHLLAGDMKGLTSPLVPLLLAGTCLYLAKKNLSVHA
jgi:hypothetical protein